ncbi:hypothetical protein BGZ70_001325 [Mortierella alpina]|uniref:Enoyl reductase (ER) domain-containing protein n=1 Tax=Mortierella alpina TaxID=64518 RepID=A0A9P6IW13_MORAP|nr:hypothetical protein BGZ70_001325 [Mortierella alpina]
MKAIVIEQTETKPAYHNATLKDVPRPESLEEDQALLEVSAVSFNHRELWIRKGQYPGIIFGSILGADGIFTEYYAARQEDIFKAPDHLTDAEAAALPLAGLTAYRAVFTKGQVAQGQNVLITGIGGGVALMALAFCVAAGANVYVTSSDEGKIAKAVRLGARGGVNYKEAGGELFDVVIDGAGGDGVKTFTQILRLGGIIVSYGMTVKPKVDFTMAAVLRNIEIRGSTMGSRLEFEQMLDYVSKHKLRPVVSQVWRGLESAEEAFEVMKKGSQFGKLVLSLKSASKL